MDNFIKNKIADDLKNGLIPDNKISLRFPPEPNGYLHLGHAKSIILNSDLAKEFNATFNLRFDDTNPEKENEEYVNAIKKDAFWLTNNFNNVFWASDYFDDMYHCAVLLISKGLAYVDDSDIETIRANRGDFNHAGVESVYRNRSIEENLILFSDMKEGKFKDGEKVLRAKIDMNSSNFNLRDPILYRIKHTTHHNTGNKWCIYSTYDYAHPIEDALEKITHSICTMEFEDHRPLYDWVIDNCFEVLKFKPTQIEFSRLELEGVVLSKRKLNSLVEERKVTSWDDPVMPTISGMRNKGFTPEILHEFITRCGVSKANSTIEKFVLEDCVRDILNPIAYRTMTIIDPVALEISNYDLEEVLDMPNHPKNEEFGSRKLTLSKNIFVERDDIRANPEEGFWRIVPGNWVRLKHGYNIFIDEVIEENGVIIKVKATMDLGSRNPKNAIHKAKVALHWLSEVDSVELPIHFYSNLYNEDGNFNEKCLIVKNGKAEKSIFEANNKHYEFERNGYFHFNNGVAHNLAPLKSTKKNHK